MKNDFRKFFSDLWAGGPVYHKPGVGLSEGGEERENGLAALVAALRHVVHQQPVQGKQPLQQPHQVVGVLVRVRVAHLMQQ